MGQGRVAENSKKRARLNGTIVFVDETGVSLIPNARKTWAKRGKTPILKHQFAWPKLSAIAGISPRGKLYFRVHEGSIRGPQAIAFLKHLLRHQPGYIIVLWDGGPTHKSKLVKQFLVENAARIEAHRLPPYAPELNPIEQMFHHIKNQQLANFAPKTKQELRRGLRRATVRVRNDPNVVRRFVGGSSLPCGTLINQRQRL